MTLWEHIEELRWVLLKSFAALLVGTGIGLALASPFYEALAIPLQRMGDAVVELVFTSPIDAFLVRLKLALAAGFILALPFILTFVWTFVAPGLKTHDAGSSSSPSASARCSSASARRSAMRCSQPGSRRS